MQCIYSLDNLCSSIEYSNRDVCDLINSKCLIYTRSYTDSPASLIATVTTTSDDDDCLPAGAIVGIVLAVIIFIVLLILCIVLLLILCYCCILPLRRRGEETTVVSFLWYRQKGKSVQVLSNIYNGACELYCVYSQAQWSW